MSKHREVNQSRKGYNSQPLMSGYQSVLNNNLDTNNEEVAEEMTNDGLKYTYNQMQDTYRQGTIDKKKK